ncbi:MAG: acyl-CoA thioesterase [Thermoflexales bacterium]|nr:acyl-CoA thioesterase [Thermoflexales bacterium]
MAVVHCEKFRVRYYECDAYGHLNNINYLRWMQEAAFAASAAVGYDYTRYEGIGHWWLVRETDIGYLAPLKYGDEVALKTWVMDWRRFHSRRAYEFTNTQTGQLAARAVTDWVYVDSKTLRPAAMPKEMLLAFLPEGTPEKEGPRERFPSPPPPPPNVFSIRRQVGWRDVDMMWHVNNAMYLAYVEDVGIQVCATHGWPMQRMMEEGFGTVARQHRIEYRRPARLGDELEIATWYSDAHHTSALRHYTIRRPSDGSLLAQARTRWVWVDLKTGRPIRIPEHFLDEFADNLALDPEGLEDP